MKTIDKTVNEFRKVCLERLHGCSYEEVVKSELSAYKTEDFMSSLSESDILQMFDPITLGLLMAALSRWFYINGEGYLFRELESGGTVQLNIRWKILRPDKTECDETDQTPETLIALTNILR